MIAALKETLASAAGKWASMIATLCARNAGLSVSNSKGKHVSNLPTCAAGGEDKRAPLPWDTSQTVAHCKVNGDDALAIIDSGSYMTSMDIAMARMLGLKVR